MQIKSNLQINRLLGGIFGLFGLYTVLTKDLAAGF